MQTANSVQAPADTGTVELSLPEQHRLVQRLAALWEQDGRPVRHIETHISHLLLHGGRAYKIKKALATSFLDQSTLERRRTACHEELRLNRRLAPELYLGVQNFTGSIEHPRLGGAGPVLEVAVLMRAFDEAGLWDRLAQRHALTSGDVDQLAAVIARFHAQAAVAGAKGWLGSPAQVRQAVLDSLQELQTAGAERTLAQLRSWEASRFATLQPVMARRLLEGRVREGHGDLHLGNVAREQGRCLVFDGVEFNDEFRWLDVISEIAFLAMDLHAHGLPALAHRWVNASIEANGDHDGLRVLDYYLVHRALVRAKVAQIRAAQEQSTSHDSTLSQTARYLALALQLSHRPPPALLITHGFSGSGKTTLTQSLLEQLGAVRVRSDVERRRIAAMQLPAAAPARYGVAMNEAVYTRLLDAARAAIEGGWPVILDATFLRHEPRQAARNLAQTLGVPFMILRFDAPMAELRRRVQARTGDASEADVTVLDQQPHSLEPLQADELEVVFEVRARGTPGSQPRADWQDLLERLAARG